VAPALALPLFAVSVLVTFLAAGYFADKLDHIGPRVGLPESAVGLLTAVAADTPEIAAAVSALVSGNKQASLGVVLGSNVFNLAAMVGVSAVAAGVVVIGRRALAIEGAVGIVSLAVAAALIVGAIPAWVALLLLVAVVAPYVVVAMRPPDVAHTQEHHHLHGEALLKPVALLVPAVALIVAGSYGMVRAALALADRWNVSGAVTGLFVLAVLTSLPNAFTAVRLGLAGRGDALVTETLASNTINLIGGVLLPALFVGLATATASVLFDLAFLGCMTVLTLGLLMQRRGLGRSGGAVLIALYVAFVAIHLALG
jgi:cation:H+ antiporter